MKLAELLSTQILSARSWSIIRGLYIAKTMWPFHVNYYFVSVIIYTGVLLLRVLLNSFVQVKVNTRSDNKKKAINNSNINKRCKMLLWADQRTNHLRAHTHILIY